jgi:hypothetical protein
MTFEDVFKFAFNNYVIWGEMAKKYGEENYLKLLKNISYNRALNAEQVASKNIKCKDFETFKKLARETNYFSENALTMEITKDTQNVFEVKITECLWAKVFQEIGMEKIGYALICYPDYASCKGYNPKICLIRTKTLMQGNKYCNHKYIWNEK